MKKIYLLVFFTGLLINNNVHADFNLYNYYSNDNLKNVKVASGYINERHDLIVGINISESAKEDGNQKFGEVFFWMPHGGNLQFYELLTETESIEEEVLPNDSSQKPATWIVKQIFEPRLYGTGLKLNIRIGDSDATVRLEMIGAPKKDFISTSKFDSMPRDEISKLESLIKSRSAYLTGFNAEKSLHELRERDVVFWDGFNNMMNTPFDISSISQGVTPSNKEPTSEESTNRFVPSKVDLNVFKSSKVIDGSTQSKTERDFSITYYVLTERTVAPAMTKEGKLLGFSDITNLTIAVPSKNLFLHRSSNEAMINVIDNVNSVTYTTPTEGGDSWPTSRGECGILTVTIPLPGQTISPTISFSCRVVEVFDQYFITTVALENLDYEDFKVRESLEKDGIDLDSIFSIPVGVKKPAKDEEGK